jgi:hypothetical protein
MKYVVEVDSVAMIRIPSSSEAGLGVQKLMGGGGDTYTHAQ